MVILTKFNEKLFHTRRGEMINNTHQLTVRYQVSVHIKKKDMKFIKF